MNWVGLNTLIMREVGRFFSVYRQTVLPGLITSALYIAIFGFTLEQRISEIQGVSYTLYILPGLIMMNTLTNATANTSSSMLQMKLLQQLPDLLTAPLSGFEISLAYIIGGIVRGVVNGIMVLILGIVLVSRKIFWNASAVSLLVPLSIATAHTFLEKKSMTVSIFVIVPPRFIFCKFFWNGLSVSSSFFEIL